MENFPHRNFSSQVAQLHRQRYSRRNWKTFDSTPPPPEPWSREKYSLVSLKSIHVSTYLETFSFAFFSSPSVRSGCAAAANSIQSTKDGGRWMVKINFSSHSQINSLSLSSKYKSSSDEASGEAGKKSRVTPLSLDKACTRHAKVYSTMIFQADSSYLKISLFQVSKIDVGWLQV